MLPIKPRQLHRRISLTLQAILVAEIIVATWSQQWLTAFVTLGILMLTLAPFFIGRFFRVFIPPEFVLLAIAFAFSSLFLGEVHGYYMRYWWWDIALHTSSGFLLGIVGFLLAHILNETEKVGLNMKPGFVALFAFMFSLSIGTLWEIFEYSMDTLFGMNMQKPMFNDPSGLTDTMWDLIVDGIGGLVIAVLGYGYLKTAKQRSFLERWIANFIEANPRFFRRQ